VIGTEGLKEVSLRILRACIQAADPASSVKNAITMRAGALVVGERRIELNGRVVLAAVGKASVRMAEAALENLGKCVTEGLIVVPHGYTCTLSRSYQNVRIEEARHPVPDEDSVRAAMDMLALFRCLGERDVCIFLLSGGGSSLLCLPQGPLGLEEKTRTTELLLRSGIDIRSINTVRKHLSGIKGGRLAAAARGTVVSLIVSDVVGDDASSIASGPTLPDPSTFAEAESVLRGCSAWDHAPAAVRKHIVDGKAGRIPETPKSLPDRHVARIISSNSAALQAAVREAEACGFAPHILTDGLSGEAREAGRMMAAAALRAGTAFPVKPPACIIAGGETTVTVRGRGRGGRNQEIALSAAAALDGAARILLTSFATDGIDGVTGAAGAHATGETAGRIRDLGMDPLKALEDNDSNAVLSAAGELIITGPTNTNVNDICFVLVDG
jgi:glycerate 2-kinase